jgi:phenylacetate-CoA ligase
MTNYLRALYYLESMRRQAYWNPRKLEEYQSRKLRKIVRYAYQRVPFYNRLFRDSGVSPEDVRTKSDLKKLPIIGKNELRRNRLEIISEDFDVNNLRTVSTSGSTGEPLFLFLSASETEFRKAKHLRANISVDQKPWDRWVTLTGPQHFPKTTALQRLIGLYTPITISVFNDVDTQVSALESIRPQVIDGYSSSMFLLAKEVEKRHIRTIKPKFVMGGAELIDEFSREYIEKVFDVPFYDQYASVEFERMAWQCKEKNMYHIDSDALIMEFVDKNGDEVSAGEDGEIVCTSLFNYAMPLIRYKIGDVGIPSDEMCACGRVLPLMQMVEGRKDYLLVLPDGQVLTPRAFTVAMHEFKFYPQIEQFRVVQKELDLFEFNLKLGNGVLEEVIRKDLISHLSGIFLGQNLRFKIEFVEDIPLDRSGKLTIVYSEVGSTTLKK